VEGKKQVRSIHIKISYSNYRKNFKNIIAIYGRKHSGFKDSRNIRFFPHPKLVKYNIARALIIKAYER